MVFGKRRDGMTVGWFWILGSWISDFGSWISDFGFRIVDLNRPRILSIDRSGGGKGRRICGVDWENFERRTPDFERRSEENEESGV
jgi:hypothetical protein